MYSHENNRFINHVGRHESEGGKRAWDSDDETEDITERRARR